MTHTWEEFGIDIRGKTSGDVRTTCPRCSAFRKKKNYPCLHADLDKTIWHCFHCDWSGSLHTGEERRSNPSASPLVFRKPVYRATPLPSRTIAWFAERGIPESVIARNRISYGPVYMPQVEQEVPAIQFPYFRNGEIVNIKYRSYPKYFRMTGGAERLLYGMDDIAGDTLLICEGEMDKLSLEVAGFLSCVSVPDGAPAPNTKNYASKFDFLLSAEIALQPITRIILAVDADAPGQALAEELARRLGPERCYRVVWPTGCKDANDVLLQHGTQTITDCITQAQAWPVHGIVSIEQLRQGLDYIYHHGMEKGCSTGWPTLSKHYTVRTSEVTIVTGIPSHGKSGFISALMMHLADEHDWRFAVFSPENYPLERFAASLLEQYIGKPFDGNTPRMSPPEMYAGTAWLHEHVTFLMPEDDAPTIDRLLDLARIQVYRHGIKGLILDPWNEMEHSRPAGQTETEYISHALSKIRRFARHHGVHVWVIAHPTKLRKAEKGEYEGQYPPPTPYDINGCYAADTEVLTMQGWRTHQQITLEDEICCFDLKTHELSYQPPTRQWEYEYDGPMIHFSSPSFDALVTPNHRMVINQTWRERKPMKGTGMGRPIRYEDAWQFIEAQDLKSDLSMPFASGLADTREELQHCAGLEMQDDVLRLIGWWVSEGCTQMGGLNICQAVGPIQRQMRAGLQRLGLFFKEGITNYRPHELPMWSARIYKRHHQQLTNWIVHECQEGAPNKRLPGAIWLMSLRQKDIILSALLDGDGHRPEARQGTASFTTTSTWLANQVQRLAIELGHPACISSTPGAQPHHLQRYQVSIGRSSRRQITLRMARHKSIESYTGKVYCLTVPTGAYVTRRNGKMLIAGNSANWRNKADNCLTIWRNVEVDDNRVEVHIQKIRFREIGKPGMVELIYEPSCGRFHEPREVVHLEDRAWSA
jgi:twinkle protein